MDNQELLKKIQKLLALAESPNEHEAETATRKAQELLVRHNLSIQQVQTLQDEYSKTNIDTVMRYKKEHSFVLDIVQEFFFVKVTLSRSYCRFSGNGYRATYNSEISLVGTPANVEVARYVYSYLVHTFKELWRTYQKENAAPLKHRTPFMLGLRDGLWSKLKETRNKVESEMGLVVIDDPDLQKYLTESLGIKKAKKETPNRRDYEAEEAGREKGKNIRIAKAVNYQSENKGLSLGFNKQ